MKQAEYDVMKRNGSGTAFCPICRTQTGFTHDEQGVIFCVSCGNEAVVQAERTEAAA